MLMAVISMLILPGIFSSYCQTPCQPRVRQENITTAVVDWGLLWPYLPWGKVTVTANGEICFIEYGIKLIIQLRETLKN